MKRGEKGCRSNETNFSSFFFFLLSLFHHCFEQFESDPFFFYGREGLFVESAGQGCEGGDSESREMLFDRQLQRIVTEGTFRHGRNCARSRITRKITAPRPWPDSVAKANTRFCYSINCEPPAHMYKQGCPIFYWPFSSLNTQWAKTSRCVSTRGATQPILCVELLNREIRRRRREKQSSCFDRCIVISSFLHNWYFHANVF